MQPQAPASPRQEQQRPDRQEFSGPALRAFFNIADAWKLSVEEQMVLLGGPSRSTFFKWKKEGGLLPHDTLERISHILGVYKDLHILFPESALADEWIRKPNNSAVFNGKSALEYMMAGGVADLFVVHRFLDAQRGG